MGKVGTGFSTSLAGIIAGPNDGLGTSDRWESRGRLRKRVDAVRQVISMMGEFLDAPMLEEQRGEGE